MPRRNQLAVTQLPPVELLIADPNPGEWLSRRHMDGDSVREYSKRVSTHHRSLSNAVGSREGSVMSARCAPSMLQKRPSTTSFLT